MHIEHILANTHLYWDIPVPPRLLVLLKHSRDARSLPNGREEGKKSFETVAHFPREKIRTRTAGERGEGPGIQMLRRGGKGSKEKDFSKDGPYVGRDTSVRRGEWERLKKALHHPLLASSRSLLPSFPARMSRYSVQIKG